MTPEERAAKCFDDWVEGRAAWSGAHGSDP
jgi:hypothetical protein